MSRDKRLDTKKRMDQLIAKKGEAVKIEVRVLLQRLTKAHETPRHFEQNLPISSTMTKLQKLRWKV